MNNYFACKKPIIGLHGELDTYSDYIYLFDSFEEGIKEMLKLKEQGNLVPKKIYPMHTEEYYMKQYTDFIKYEVLKWSR